MTWILWGVAGLFAFVKIAERVVQAQKARQELQRRQIRRQMRSLEMAVHEGNENAAAQGRRRFVNRGAGRVARADTPNLSARAGNEQ